MIVNVSITGKVSKLNRKKERGYIVGNLGLENISKISIASLEIFSIAICEFVSKNIKQKCHVLHSLVHVEMLSIKERYILYAIINISNSSLKWNMVYDIIKVMHDIASQKLLFGINLKLHMTWHLDHLLASASMYHSTPSVYIE